MADLPPSFINVAAIHQFCKRLRRQMFFGTYTHTIDDTGRLTIPRRFRDFVAEAESVPRLFFTCGAERCIVAYTESRVTQILAGINDGSVNRDQARAFKRIFGGEGAMETWDKQGRIVVPEALKQHAGIDKDVIIVGAVDCFEIWNASAYEKHRDAVRTAYDQVADKIIQ